MHPHSSIFYWTTIPAAQSGVGSRVTRCTPLPRWMAEVLSALARLHRAGDLDAGTVETKLHELAAAPIQRHAVNDLLLGTWARRHRLRLDDAVYVELAARRGLHLVTTDHRLRAAPSVQVVSV